MRDFGFVREGRPIKLKIVTDASAAKGISQRKGLGQVRHIEVNTLWLQDKVRSGDIAIEKVGGKVNIADALTKFPDGESQNVHVVGVGLVRKTGGHELAPQTTEDEIEVLKV